MATGDFNGDGAQDLVIGAALGDGPGNARPDGGEAYVLLGPIRPGERDLAAGAYDAVIYGAGIGDQLARSLSAGDFNADGKDDIALGAPFADMGAPTRDDSGGVYVVPGSEGLGPSRREYDLNEREVGTVLIEGADAGDFAGFTLDAADVSGDGFRDLIIAAFWADGPDNDRSNAGEVYVVNGGASFGSLDLASGDQDATVFGADSEDRLGEAVGTGDVNGDGVADLLPVGTFADGPDEDRDAAGETYVILGPAPRRVDIAAGEQNATIVGVDAGDQLGHSIAAGDVDGDGRDDVVLGAVSAAGPGNALDLAGEVVLVPGSAKIPPLTDASFAATAYGAAAGDRFGRSAAAGDLNADGLSDVVAAAPEAGDGTSPESRAGVVSWVFGGTAFARLGDGSRAAATITGDGAGDNLGHQGFGIHALLIRDIDGDGFGDILVSAPLADGPGNERGNAGEAWVVFMRRQPQSGDHREAASRRY
jgi:hypothetical protein